MSTPRGATWTSMVAEDVPTTIANHLDAASVTGRVDRILDAGAGRSLPFRLPAGARLTGLDVSPASLADNPLVDERIVGDLEIVQLPPEGFDAAVCWNVLEHLPHPRAALSNLHSTLRPDGMLILGVPNLASPKAIVTKLTPHWFHVWVYRRVLGSPDAGRPGYAPFRTYLRSVLLPRRLRRHLEELGFVVEAEIRYSSGMVAAIVRANIALRIGWGIVATLWRLGGSDPELSDVAFILRKRGPTRQHAT